MVRKLATLLSLVFVAGTAQALGLGELNLKSALNQPLLAEIELLEEENLTRGEVLSSLAGNEDFERAGVQRFFFLSNIRFRVIEKGNRQLAIELTTSENVTEPFLNFLVEVNWPAGRLLREYTVLLDPPVYDDMPVAKIEEFSQATTASGVDSQVAESAPASSQSTPSVPVEAVTSAPSVSFQQEPATQPQVATRTAEEPLGPNQYRVRPNDTLWEIAVDVRPTPSLSPQQVMLAIQEANPSAFVRGNINILKAGSLLQIPTAADMDDRSFNDAVAEVSRQNRLFVQPESSGTEAPVTASDSASSALSDGSDQNPEGYLELVTADVAGEGASAGGEAGERITALENELAMALELNDQFEREKDNLETRLADLEEQLQIMQRMLNLQSETAAILQNQDQIAANETPEPMAETSPMTEQSAATETETPAPTATAPQTTTAQPNPPVQPVVPVQPFTPEEPEGFISYLLGDVIGTLMDNVMYQAAAGGVVILLLLLLMNSMAKRRKQQSEDSDEDDQGLMDFEDESELGDEFTTDFLGDEMEDLELGGEEFDEDAMAAPAEQSDAVTEADIYMAYGKYDQAEDLLKQASIEHPSREDVKLKLAEVYAESGNSQGFAKVEQDLQSASPMTVEALGELKLKLGPEAMGDMIEQDLSESETDMDLGDSSEFDLTGEFELPGGDDNLESLSKDDEFSMPTLENLDSEESGDLDFSLDSDLSMDDIKDVSEPEQGTSFETEGEESLGGLDFNLDDFSLDSESESESTAEESLETVDEDDGALDFNMDDFSLDLGSESESETETESAAESDDQEFDFNLDLDGSDEAGLDLELPELGSDDEMNLDIPELGDDDELILDVEMPELEEGEINPLAALDAQIEALSSSFDGESSEREDEIEIAGDLGDLDLDLEQDTGMAESDADLDLDIPELDLDLAEPETLEELETDVPVLESESELESDLEAELPTLEPESESVEAEPVMTATEDELELGEDDEFDFLAGSDEASTKLDLARAYIDMDDRDGARDILEEVVQEGNDEQKEKAKELLQQIA